jgi:AcrR family transcriptional regulator
MNERSIAVRKRGEDRRVQRTKIALGRALVEAMLAEEFDAITVQSLLDRAGVGRTTFYAHFRDKEDLLLSDAERFLEGLERYFETACGARVAPVAELFHHVREFREFDRALGRSGRRGQVYALFVGHLARMIEKRIQALAPGANDLTVISRMFSGALMELLQWWLERDSAHTPAWIDQRFHALVWAGLKGTKPSAPSSTGRTGRPRSPTGDD